MSEFKRVTSGPSITHGEVDNEGVILPENEGVVRPLRLEATEEGREIGACPTVGDESFEAAMKTPQLGGQVKYRFLYSKVS